MHAKPAVATKRFTKTAKQREACAILNANRHALLVGGGRSTKTTIIVRNIVARAIKRPSRHLIVRACFNHVKQSIWHDTFPKVMKGFFPGVQYKENKSDWYIRIPCCEDFPGEYSEIWFGGTDTKERTEKILGNEYSTIFANECSQIGYEEITMLRTRLAENSGLTLRFYYDLNPVGKKHWTNQELIKKINPEDLTPSKIKAGHLFMNPIDNPHLPPEVLEEYEALPKRKKLRFLKGLYLDDVEGALWNDIMIAKAHARSFGDLKKIVVSVDPAVVHREGNDETGIIVAGKDDNDIGVLLADYTATGSVSTKTWAQRAVNAYHDYEANEIVVETNQGGDLVVDALKNIDRTVKVVKVSASKGKFARAEPIAELYELGEIAHAKELTDLESEMTEWVPENTKESPNRIDAAVWALTRLKLKKAKRINVGSV